MTPPWIPAAQHPLVLASGIRFYAGIPLVVAGKHNLGTLCIMDYQPRHLTEQDLQTLMLLSTMAVDALELHIKSIEVHQLNSTLRISEQHFRSVFDQAGVGVSIANAHTGAFLETNKKYCEIVGYSLDELENIDLMSITHPDDQLEQQKMTAALCSGQVSEYTIQKRYIRKDKSIIWVDIACTALWNSGETPTEHIAIVQDINDKKLAELALQESDNAGALP